MNNIIFKILFYLTLLIFSATSRAEIILDCTVNFQEKGLLRNVSNNTKIILTINSSTGTYWNQKADGNIETKTQIYTSFEIDNPEINYKFTSLPNNRDSYVSDKSNNSLWKYEKTTNYKNNSKKIESIYLNRSSGRLEIASTHYLTFPTTISSNTTIDGHCEKSSNINKF